MTSKSQSPSLPTADIQARGRSLQKRFRDAGIPQYTRWMIERRPKMGEDFTVIDRMRKVFNGEGARRDTALLILCEEIADLYLPKQAA